MTVDLAGAPLENHVPILLEALTCEKTNRAIEFATNDDPRALLLALETAAQAALSASRSRVGVDSWLVRLDREEAAAPRPVPAFLRGSLFRSLDREAHELLASSAREFSGRRNDVIARSDEQAESVGVVLEGMLAVTTESSRRARLLAELFPGDVFGEIAFLDRGRMIGNVVVWSKAARYVLMPCALLHDLTQRFPQFARDFSTLCAQRTRGLVHLVDAQTAGSVMSRVACALLPYAPPAATLVPALPPLENLTLSHIAVAAGTVKEVVSRIVGELESQGALARRRGHIFELNRSKLLRAARSDKQSPCAAVDDAVPAVSVAEPSTPATGRSSGRSFISVNALFDAIDRANDAAEDDMRRLGIRIEDLGVERS